MMGRRPMRSPIQPPSGRATRLANVKPALRKPALATDSLNIFSKYPGNMLSTANSPPKVTA